MKYDFGLAISYAEQELELAKDLGYNHQLVACESMLFAAKLANLIMQECREPVWRAWSDAYPYQGKIDTHLIDWDWVRREQWNSMRDQLFSEVLNEKTND